jgi:transposase-like protein
MGARVAVHAVILRYLDEVARVRSIRRAAEDLPAERGLDVSYESVRRWVLKFEPDVFGEDRQARNRRGRSKKSIQRRERMIEDMRKAGVPEG